MQWGSCIEETPGSGESHGSGESCQELAALTRAAGKAWEGPGAAVATPPPTLPQVQRQPLGSMSDQECGNQGVVCQSGCGVEPQFA